MRKFHLNTLTAEQVMVIIHFFFYVWITTNKKWFCMFLTASKIFFSLLLRSTNHIMDKILQDGKWGLIWLPCLFHSAASISLGIVCMFYLVGGVFLQQRPNLWACFWWVLIQLMIFSKYTCSHFQLLGVYCQHRYMMWKSN